MNSAVSTEQGWNSCSWLGVDAPSRERLFWRCADGVQLRSTVETTDERFEYRATLDRNWLFRSLRIHTASDRQLVLARDAGEWRVNGRRRDDLVSAFDVDLSFSPATNTLPIRRLGLAVGESAELTAAYVDAPSLQVSTDGQRYTRTATDRYLYESLDGDFSREITVDPDGFVVDYPGLFRRIRPDDES